MTKEIIENDPYKSAGVDIDAGNDLVDRIKRDVASSHNENVVGNIGGFAGMFKLSKDFDEPILVACTDGVGTKVALAQESNEVDGIGQDLVAMCVNDLIVCGAKPLFFLDYFASSKLEVDEASRIIKSIANGCKDSGCALLGGETAEMPGHYVGKNFDLAGFSVGCVEKNKIIDGRDIKENQQIYEIPAGREINELLWFTRAELDAAFFDPFMGGFGGFGGISAESTVLQVILHFLFVVIALFLDFLVLGPCFPISKKSHLL